MDLWPDGASYLSHAESRFATDALQPALLRRSGYQARLKPGVDLIGMATDCVKRTCKPRLLAQALRKSSTFLICTQGKS
jgi:hypothetical protein